MIITFKKLSDKLDIATIKPYSDEHFYRNIKKVFKSVKNSDELKLKLQEHLPAGKRFLTDSEFFYLVSDLSFFTELTLATKSINGGNVFTLLSSHENNSYIIYETNGKIHSKKTSGVLKRIDTSFLYFMVCDI